jgi:hypothetical protein
MSRRVIIIGARLSFVETEPQQKRVLKERPVSSYRPETRWANHEQAESDKKPRAEPVFVETTLDDLWLELKLLSNLEIAGSPRYSFRTSVRRKVEEVEHWI